MILIQRTFNNLPIVIHGLRQVLEITRRSMGLLTPGNTEEARFHRKISDRGEINVRGTAYKLS